MKRLFLVIALYCYNALADTVTIVGKQTSIENISRNEAKSLYLMKSRRLNDGQSVILFQMPQSSYEHKKFVRDVLGMPIEQYKRELDRLINAGLSMPIRIVSSKQDMLNSVAITYNSIGYIDADHLIIYSGENDVKTLKIID